MLGSNSYLGLTNHPKIKEAAQAAVEKYGTGCAGSRFLNGTLDIHLELEARPGPAVNKEAVLLYSTGFQVNLGVISALVGKGEYVLGDKSNHASIVEGCLLAQGKFLRFAHRDMAALESRLEAIEPEAGKLIVVDGVFSMEGDIIQLPELCRLAGQYGAAVMVDDAHAIGVLGRTAPAPPSHFGLTDQVHLIMGTFSKSLASLGGFIASDAETIDYLKHHSRPLIFSASMSPANAAAVLAALEIMLDGTGTDRAALAQYARMKKGLIDLGFDLGASRDADPAGVLPGPDGGVQVVQAAAGGGRVRQSGGFAGGAARSGVDPRQPDGHAHGAADRFRAGKVWQGRQGSGPDLIEGPADRSERIRRQPYPRSSSRVRRPSGVPAARQRSADRGPPPDLELRVGSIIEPELDAAMTDVTHVIHCAGATKALRAADFFAVNQGGARSVVEAINRQEEEFGGWCTFPASRPGDRRCRTARHGKTIRRLRSLITAEQTRRRGEVRDGCGSD